MATFRHRLNRIALSFAGQLLPPLIEMTPALKAVLISLDQFGNVGKPLVDRQVGRELRLRLPGPARRHRRARVVEQRRQIGTAFFAALAGRPQQSALHPQQALAVSSYE